MRRGDGAVYDYNARNKWGWGESYVWWMGAADKGEMAAGCEGECGKTGDNRERFDVRLFDYEEVLEKLTFRLNRKVIKRCHRDYLG